MLLVRYDSVNVLMLLVRYDCVDGIVGLLRGDLLLLIIETIVKEDYNIYVIIVTFVGMTSTVPSTPTRNVLTTLAIASVCAASFSPPKSVG